MAGCGAIFPGIFPVPRENLPRAPANGRYVVEIRDLHLRGGPAFVYFLKVTRSEPSRSP